MAQANHSSAGGNNKQFPSVSLKNTDSNRYGGGITTRKELKEANENLGRLGAKARILFFADNSKQGCGATVMLETGEPCILSLAQSGVWVKKSRHGYFGAGLFQEEKA